MFSSLLASEDVAYQSSRTHPRGQARLAEERQATIFARKAEERAHVEVEKMRSELEDATEQRLASERKLAKDMAEQLQNLREDNKLRSHRSQITFGGEGSNPFLYNQRAPAQRATPQPA